MLCMNCKAKIRNDSRVCPHCGQATEDYSFPNNNNQSYTTYRPQQNIGPQSNQKVFLIFLVVFFITFVFIRIQFYKAEQVYSNSPANSSIQKVIRMSDYKGFDISWNDFKDLDCKKTVENGQQFLRCDVSDTFELLVEGQKKKKRPDKVDLALKINNGISLDIRSGNAKKFIEEYDGLN